MRVVRNKRTNAENSVDVYTCRNDSRTANAPHRMAIPTPSRHTQNALTRHLGAIRMLQPSPGRVVVWLSGRSVVNTVQEKSDRSATRHKITCRLELFPPTVISLSEPVAVEGTRMNSGTRSGTCDIFLPGFRDERGN